MRIETIAFIRAIYPASPLGWYRATCLPKSLLALFVAVGAAAAACYFVRPTLCVAKGTCIFDCHTKQCTWDGVPVTLSLGMYTTADLYSDQEYFPPNPASYSGGTEITRLNFFLPVSAEYRTETNCVLYISTGTAYKECPEHFLSGDSCPRPAG